MACPDRSGIAPTGSKSEAMALLIQENDVQELLPMERALELVEASFVAQARGEGINRPRQRIFLPGASLHYMAAALVDEKLMGMKIYTVAPDGLRFVVLLFDAASGQLLAFLEADHLGRIRTGAASGVATKYLARADASRVGLIGTGRQARTQLEAVAKVRQLTAAKVFGRDENRRRDFCREMSERLALPVEPVPSAEAAARFGDIVVTATTSSQPVVRGEWLRPGTHVNAIGANMARRREVDDLTLQRASLIVVDSIQQARDESGDLIQGFTNLGRDWTGVVELHEIVAGTKPARKNPHEITLFKSNGIALWDVAVAGHVYRQAVALGKGSPLASS